MKSRPTRDQIDKINHLLVGQNEIIRGMKLFGDGDQEDSLHYRSNIAKNNYKYLSKLTKAQDLIKTAKVVNENRQNHVKMGYFKKNIIRNQSSLEAIEENKQKQSIASKSFRQAARQSTSKSVSKAQNESLYSRIENNNALNVAQQQQKPIQAPIMTQGLINKSILHIQYEITKNYFKEKIKYITTSTTPEQVYRFLNPFYQLCGVKVILPLIKKYRNCVFFGDSNKKLEKNYEGFLIFPQQSKLYYGQLSQEKKHGRGVEIDFINDVVYVGTFDGGRKNGHFTVYKPHEKYVGQLKKGVYNGRGQLTTDFSIYKGSFVNGERHGEGEQFFLKMGLTICGTFLNNKFSNHSSKNEEQSRLNTINSKSKTLSKHQNELNQNPQNRQLHLKDKTVVFQQSPYSKQHYQEFNCDYGNQEEDIDEIEMIKAHKVPAFRIKQSKQKPPAKTHRKTTISKEERQPSKYR